jgi:hypothetical protein
MRIKIRIEESEKYNFSHDALKKDRIFHIIGEGTNNCMKVRSAKTSVMPAR